MGIILIRLDASPMSFRVEAGLRPTWDDEKGTVIHGIRRWRLSLPLSHFDAPYSSGGSSFCAITRPYQRPLSLMVRCCVAKSTYVIPKRRV